jgi:hypothetical protein
MSPREDATGHRLHGLTLHDALAEGVTGFGYNPPVMSPTASEALVHLDALRERLKEASGRLGWLRSYL